MSVYRLPLYHLKRAFAPSRMHLTVLLNAKKYQFKA